MVKIQILILSILILSVISCQTDQPNGECPAEFKSLYQTLQNDFKNTFSKDASGSYGQTLKNNLQKFLDTYPQGYKCSWDGKIIDIREEVKSFSEEIVLPKSQTKGEKVIYGTDDRVDIELSSSESYKVIAQSVAGMIKKSDINPDLTVSSGTLGTDMNLCSTESFFHQKNPMICTGFLVGEDILVTAGHCITSVSDCAKYSFVFEYKNTTTQLNVDDIYECSSLISRKFFSEGLDYSVVKLDRKVVGRAPLKFRRNGKINDAENLFVVGHPSGLPLKVANDAYVRDNSNNDYFVANLDTFSGNSGSPVFSETTQEVEGVLVRGEEDYYYEYSEGCYKTYKCSMGGCRGEDVTRITQVTGLPADTSPVNGGWSSWSAWSACTSGIQNRMRTCNNPTPSYGGSDCIGENLETKKCVNHSKDEIIRGLFETSSFSVIDGRFYKLKRYFQGATEIVGRKFLSECALYTKTMNADDWYSYFAGDCKVEKNKIEKIYDDFEGLVLTN